MRWRHWAVGALILIVGFQTVASVRFGVSNGRANRADMTTAGTIAVHLTAIPPSARVGLATTYDYPVYSQFLTYLDLARRDQLGEFGPGSTAYRNLDQLQVLPPPQEG
jgi:hypothetical protein